MTKAEQAMLVELMDMVSLPSVQKVERQYYLESGDDADRPPEFLQRMIDKGSSVWTIGISLSDIVFDGPVSSC